MPFVADFHGHHDDEHDEDHGGVDEDEEHDEDENGHEEEEELDRVSLDSARTHFRFNWGLRDLGAAINSFTLKLGYTDWMARRGRVLRGRQFRSRHDV